MHLIKHRSDPTRQIWLKRVLETATLSSGFGSGLLPKDLVNRLKKTERGYRDALTRKQNLLSLRRGRIESRDQQLNELKLLCRAFHTSLKARALYMGHGGEIFPLFGLALSGNQPHMSHKTDWLFFAESLVAGDALAVEKGYPPMTNPRASQLNRALKKARAAFKHLDQTNLAVEEAIEALDPYRKEADILQGDVAAYLRYRLRSLEASRRREVMRRHGFAFQGDPPQPKTELTPEAEEPDHTRDAPPQKDLLTARTSCPQEVPSDSYEAFPGAPARLQAKRRRSKRELQ